MVADTDRCLFVRHVYMYVASADTLFPGQQTPLFGQLLVARLVRDRLGRLAMGRYGDREQQGTLLGSGTCQLGAHVRQVRMQLSGALTDRTVDLDHGPGQLESDV